MKEQVTVRLYDDPERCLHCEDARYVADPASKGGAWERGDTVALDERNGGRIFGVIDRVEDEKRSDEHGAYRLATVWTQD